VEPQLAGAGAEDGLGRLPAHDPQREPASELVPERARDRVRVGFLRRDDGDDADAGADLSQVGQQEVDPGAPFRDLQIPLHLVDYDEDDRHAKPFADLRRDLAAVVSPVPVIHLLHEPLERLYELAWRVTPDAADVDVARLPGRLERAVALAVGEDDLDSRVHEAGHQQRTHGKTLALPWLRAEQERRVHD